MKEEEFIYHNGIAYASDKDEKTEEKVLANMMKEFPNRTRIITTHRPSMLQYCTRIYRVNDSGILTEEEIIR